MRSFLVLLVLVCASLANAGVLIEPYLGYQTGETKYKYISGQGPYSDQQVGASLGLRLAFVLKRAGDPSAPTIVYLGADGSYFSGKQTADKGNISSENCDVTGSSIYGIVGFLTFPGFAVRIGYAPMDSYEHKETVPYRTNGSAYKVGLALNILLFSINADYIMHSVEKKIDNTGSETKTSDVYKDYSYNQFLISMSVPFVI